MAADSTDRNILLQEKESSFCYNTKLNDDLKKDLINLNLKLLVDVLHTILMFVWFYIWYIMLAAVLWYILDILYRAYISPVTYKRGLTESGFDHLPSGKDKNMHIMRSQAARKLGNKIPPPYPNGWYALVGSKELRAGEVVPVDSLGQNFAVYRGEDGEVRCVDAYCPHLGANLGVGGAVHGNCIECPFHNWKFDENGACVSVPGVENVPKGISLKKWRTVEFDNAVWVWYDAEDRDPLWELQDSQEIKAWGYRGRSEFYVNAHIQEINENSADGAHFNAVHLPSMVSDLGEKYPILYNLIGYQFSPINWQKSEDHTAHMSLKLECWKFFKLQLGDVDVEVKHVGPSHVRIILRSTIGPVLLTQTVTPLSPILQKVVHKMYSPAHTAPIAALMVKFDGYMFERDVNIWNSKKFSSAPAYVKTDKSISTFRKWYSQFYSKKSITFRDAIQNPLDW